MSTCERNCCCILWVNASFSFCSCTFCFASKRVPVFFLCGIVYCTHFLLTSRVSKFKKKKQWTNCIISSSFKYIQYNLILKLSLSHLILQVSFAFLAQNKSIRNRSNNWKWFSFLKVRNVSWNLSKLVGILHDIDRVLNERTMHRLFLYRFSGLSICLL